MLAPQPRQAVLAAFTRPVLRSRKYFDVGREQGSRYKGGSMAAALQITRVILGVTLFQMPRESAYILLF